MPRFRNRGMYVPVGRRPYTYLSSSPGTVPRAPALEMWSIRLWPSSPLELASPVGKRGLVEFNRICAVPSVEAQRKMSRPKYSRVALVFASITRTPVARSVRSSYITLWTIASVTTVSLPVFRAAGSVAERLEDYAPELQPRAHWLRAWQAPRPHGAL